MEYLLWVFLKWDFLNVFAYGCVNVFIVFGCEVAIVIANLKISYSGHTFHSHATLV